MSYRNKNILCINIIYTMCTNYSYISIHDGRRLMMMYDIHMHLDSFSTITSDGSKYITSTFNNNTQKKNILYVCIELIHVQFLHS